MAKKTKKPKSKTLWVLLDEQCRTGCHRYNPKTAVDLCLKNPSFKKQSCGCIISRYTSCHKMMSLAEYHRYFANAPKLVPGAPPVKVRLRMEIA